MRTRLMSTCTALVFLILSLFLSISAQSATIDDSPKPPNLSAKQWREDLQTAIKTIESVHPNPYRHISREKILDEVNRLSSEIPKLSREKIIVRMMGIVASFEDGHTSLTPSDPNGFNHWYPIRFYRFNDGIFVTAVSPEHKELLGARILNIGEFSASQAALRTSSIISRENEFNQKENIHYISNATVLYALGISERKDQVSITYEDKDGRTKKTKIDAVVTTFTSDSWTGWGEMYSPPKTKTITSFMDLPAEEYRTGRKDLPLHLRERLPYWYELLDKDKTLYFQFNFVQNYGDVSFAEFYKQMFARADASKIERFILDIRYNGGGDGSMLLPFVHEIIKRDYLNQPGRIYTIVGRKTFSAGVMLARMMDKHTKNIFVGEPMGAAFNHFGDAGSIELPNSKLELHVSTIYHQLSSSADKQRFESIDVPAVFDSASYFAGKDVTLDAINNLAETSSIPDLFLSNDKGEVALAEYRRRQALYKNVVWWKPFSEAAMNIAAYTLLEDKRIEDSINAFELNAKHFPNSWNVWDSLAEAYMTKGNKAKAIELYKKSLALNPLNSNAAHFITELTKSNPERK